MALPTSHQLRYWGIAAVVFFLLIWALGDVLLPFIVGGAIAYFLDPVADRLERAGLSASPPRRSSRWWRFCCVVLLVLAVIPTLVNQLTALVNAAPDIAKRLQGFLLERFPELADSTSTIRQTLAEIGMAIQARGRRWRRGCSARRLGDLGRPLHRRGACGGLLPPPRLGRHGGRIDSMLPLDHAPPIPALRARLTRCWQASCAAGVGLRALGTFYAVALMAAGLQFRLIVGAIAGAITFIPYVGSLVGGALAIGLALFQFWGDWCRSGSSPRSSPWASSSRATS